MGLIQKKDEKDVIDGIEVIGRGEGPDDSSENPIELVGGESAENIAAGTTADEVAAEAEAQMVADAADEALMEGIEDEAAAEDSEPEADAEADAEKGAAKKTAADKTSEPASTEPTSTEPAPTESEPKAKGKLPANHGPLFIVIAVVLVIAAAVGGYAVGHGGFGSKGTSSATLTEDELDSTVATWTYNGETHDVTAREAIEAQYSLENAQDDDGNYAAPSSETIVSYIRNQILLAEADSRGITVTDDEKEEYAENSIGTSDYATMAEQYGVTEDQAKQIVEENAIVSKLYNQIVPDTSDATMPDAPTEPEDGDTSTASKEYAEYIINLAGDEWDSEKGTWASEDGAYYAALGSEDFTADSATYEQAQTAYYVAYQEYVSASQELQSSWSEFANGLYANASVDIYGLYV